MRREGGPSQGWSRSSWSRWSSPAEGLQLTNLAARAASHTYEETEALLKQPASAPATLPGSPMLVDWVQVYGYYPASDACE